MAARRCVTCGDSFDEATWVTLDLAERIDASIVQTLVLDWPPDRCIEVRRCNRCRRLISASRRTGA